MNNGRDGVWCWCGRVWESVVSASVVCDVSKEEWAEILSQLLFVMILGRPPATTKTLVAMALADACATTGTCSSSSMEPSVLQKSIGWDSLN